MVVALSAGKIECINKVALELFNYSPQEVIGEHLNTLIPKDPLLKQVSLFCIHQTNKCRTGKLISAIVILVYT